MDGKDMAVKQYNWRGQVVAYCQQSSWIPAGVDGWASRELESRIHCGECKLQEPEITLVYDIYGEKDDWRGYLWIVTV